MPKGAMMSLHRQCHYRLQVTYIYEMCTRDLCLINDPEFCPGKDFNLILLQNGKLSIVRAHETCSACT